MQRHSNSGILLLSDCKLSSNVTFCNDLNGIILHSSVNNNASIGSDDNLCEYFDLLNHHEYIRNFIGHKLDLCFSSYRRVIVSVAVDALLPCDVYHPPFTVTIPVLISNNTSVSPIITLFNSHPDL